MKALKEKRIGLRSLWRRGLVILSLFALVFASCDSGDSGDSGPAIVPGGPAPRSIEIVQESLGSMVDSYEGLPVDLAGLKVLIRYEGGPENNRVVNAAEGGFYTNPPKAVGVIGMISAASGLGSGAYNSSLVWLPMRNYQLLLDTGSGYLTTELELPKTVIPVSRADAWTNVNENSDWWAYENVDDKWENTVKAWSKGLRLTGDLKQGVYVDQDPTLANYTLQAEYMNRRMRDIPLKADTDWAIVPRYDRLPDTGTGHLEVTVGANPLVIRKGDNRTVATNIHPYIKKAYEEVGTVTLKKDDSDDPTDYTIVYPDGTALTSLPNGIDPALTIAHEYAEVWHVKTMELVSDPGLDPFYYWYEDEEASAWIKRLVDKNAEIKVTYSNDTTKQFSVDAAWRMNAVWHNEAPGWDMGDIDRPFGVKGIKASAGGVEHNRNRNPGITLNYRGAPYFLQVPVYTRLVSISVRPKDGGESVAVDMRQRDNDLQAMNATAFSKRIDVVATFSAFMNSELTADLPLTFDSRFFGSETQTQGVPVDFNGADATEDNYGDNETTGNMARAGSYSMTFGAHKQWNRQKTNPDDGSDGYWYEADDVPAPTEDQAGWGVCNNTRNNGREVAVVFYYRPPVNKGGVTSASARNTRLPVAWTNIGVR